MIDSVMLGPVGKGVESMAVGSAVSSATTGESADGGEVAVSCTVLSCTTVKGASGVSCNDSRDPDARGSSEISLCISCPSTPIGLSCGRPSSALTLSGRALGGGGGSSGVLGLSMGSVMLWLRGDLLFDGTLRGGSGSSGVSGRIGGDDFNASSLGIGYPVGGVGGRMRCAYFSGDVVPVGLTLSADPPPLGIRSLLLLHSLPFPRIDGLSRDSGLDNDGESVRLLPHPRSIGRSLSLETGLDLNGCFLGDKLVRRLRGGGAQRSP